MEIQHRNLLAGIIANKWIIKHPNLKHPAPDDIEEGPEGDIIYCRNKNTEDPGWIYIYGTYMRAPRLHLNSEERDYILKCPVQPVLADGTSVFNTEEINIHIVYLKMLLNIIENLVVCIEKQYITYLIFEYILTQGLQILANKNFRNTCFVKAKTFKGLDPDLDFILDLFILKYPGLYY